VQPCIATYFVDRPRGAQATTNAMDAAGLVRAAIAGLVVYARLKPFLYTPCQMVV